MKEGKGREEKRERRIRTIVITKIRRTTIITTRIIINIKRRRNKNDNKKKGFEERVLGEKRGTTSETAEEKAFWGILSQTKASKSKIKNNQNKSKC